MKSRKNSGPYRRNIFCCGCKKDVLARLTNGSQIYPHRPDLAELPFWMCETCGAYVGCHHKTKDRTKPLGNLPNEEMRNARKHIHKILDPIWKSGRLSRKNLYGIISNIIGYEYHTGELKDLDEARRVYKIVKIYSSQLRSER